MTIPAVLLTLVALPAHQQRFFLHVMPLWQAIPGRLNALNLSCYSGWNEQGAHPPPRVLLTFRQGQLSAQALAVMRTLVDGGAAVLIELEPLPPGDIRTLLEGIRRAHAAGLDAQLYAYAGGNPLFVLETVKLLIEEGRLEEGVPERLAPPGHTGSVLERRLARLSPGALNVARAAAALRSDFTPEVVAAVLGAALLDTATAWEELEAAQVLTGERFSHDLKYEAVWQGTPGIIQRLLHRASARVLGA